MGRYTMFIDWGSQCSLLSKLTVRNNAIPIKMTVGWGGRNQDACYKFIWKFKGARIAKIIFKK